MADPTVQWNKCKKIYIYPDNSEEAMTEDDLEGHMCCVYVTEHLVYCYY